MVVGKIVQVIGPVVDVDFPAGQLPKILNALRLTNPSISDQADNLVGMGRRNQARMMMCQGVNLFERLHGNHSDTRRFGIDEGHPPVPRERCVSK